MSNPEMPSHKLGSQEQDKESSRAVKKDTAEKSGSIDWGRLPERRRRLPKLVRGAIDYSKAVDGIKFGATESEVEEQLDRAVAAAEKGIAEGVYDSVRLLEEKVRGLEQKIKSIDAGEFETEEEKTAAPTERAAIQAELDEVKLRLAEQKESDEYVYSSAVRSNAEKMREKAGIVRTYSEHPEALAGYLKHLWGVDLAVDSSTRVEYGAFSISVFLRSEEFAKIDRIGGAGGYHFPGSPINVIREGYDDHLSRIIVNHENTHNALDSMPHVAIKDEQYNEMLSVLGIELDPGKRPEQVELQQRLEISKRVDRTIDSQHNELLAALEQAEYFNFGARMDLPMRLQTLSTAGNELSNMLAYSESWANSAIIDNGQRMMMYEYNTMMKERLAELIMNIRTSLEVAKRLDEKRGDGGSEAMESVHALFLALRPSQYELIWTHLKQQHGARLVEGLKGSIEIYDEEKVDVDSLGGLCRLIEDDPESITFEQRKNVFSTLGRFSERSLGPINPILLNKMGLTSADRCVRFANDVKTLADTLGYGASAEKIIDNIWRSFIRTELLVGQLKGYSSVPEIVERLPEDYRAVFNSELVESVEGLLKNQYLLNNFGVSSVRDADALPHWTAIREAGLEQIIRSRVASISEAAKG